MKLRSSIKQVIQYTISLGLAGLLIWFVFRNVDFEYMISRLQDIRYGWVFLSIFLAILSNIIRAYRWNMLLEPLGYHNLSIYRTFLAVMVGYLANMAFPRAGEVSKCGALVKTDRIPLTTSLGTVVAERIIDLLGLVIVLGMTFIIEFGKIRDIFIGLFQEKLSGYGQYSAIIIILAILVPGVMIGVYLFLRSTYSASVRRHPFYVKMRSFFISLIGGITSVSKLRNPSFFWISTILIWVCYYFMAYVVFFSMDETMGLSAGAGLAILAMGSIGMAAPVQGGIGAFHLLVASTLAMYGLNETDGTLFATVLHTSQMLFYILAGGLAVLLVAITGKKDAIKSGNKV